MVSHNQVAKAFINRRKATGSRMYTDGKVIHSYGSHFPVSLRLKNGDYLFNTDKYSVSTSKHQRYVRSEIECSKLIECSTEEIQRAIEYPNEPIIIRKEREVASIQGGIDVLYRVCKKKGMKRFPMKIIKDMIEDKILLDAI